MDRRNCQQAAGLWAILRELRAGGRPLAGEDRDATEVGDQAGRVGMGSSRAAAPSKQGLGLSICDDLFLGTVVGCAMANQGVGEVEPEPGQNEATGQVRQAVALASGWYLPGVHSEHVGMTCSAA